MAWSIEMNECLSRVARGRVRKSRNLAIDTKVTTYIMNINTFKSFPEISDSA